MRSRLPEIFLGAFLAVAIFAIGMLFASSRLLPVQNTATRQTAEVQSLWIPTDSVGLYTLVLAAFTALLVGVSAWQGYFLLRADRTARIAANASKESADALTQSERAHVFIKIEAQDFMEATTSADLAKITIDGFVSTPVTVEYRFKNYGKTPATIKEVSRDIIVSANCPNEIEYLPVEFVPTERVLAADAETDPPWKCIRTHLSKGELMEIIRAQKSFWFYGRVLYDDVFGIGHEHRFIYRYNSSRGWRSFDHETYSKNT
jgi:hypothetical protein